MSDRSVSCFTGYREESPNTLPSLKLGKMQ